MKIAILAIAYKPKLLNIFIESFKAKNTQNDYDFYIVEQEQYNYSSNVIKFPFINISDYLSRLDDILSKDYDFVILTENDCFCLKSIEGLLERLSEIDNWQVCGNTQFNFRSNVSTNFEPIEETEDSYINYDFAILNPKTCCKENENFCVSLEEEDADYLDRLILNIVNYNKIVYPDLFLYSVYPGQKDVSNRYVVRFDDIENKDQISITKKFLPEYKKFIEDNNLDFDYMENIDYKLSIAPDFETDFLLNYYNCTIESEECQITVLKN